MREPLPQAGLPPYNLLAPSDQIPIMWDLPTVTIVGLSPTGDDSLSGRANTWLDDLPVYEIAKSSIRSLYQWIFVLKQGPKQLGHLLDKLILAHCHPQQELLSGGVVFQVFVPHPPTI